MTRQLVLHLNDPKELFVFDPTTYDPFDPDALGEAGVEYLFQQARVRLGAIPTIRLTIYLPSASYRPDDEAKMRTALRTYCEGQLASGRQTHAAFLVDNVVYLVLAIGIALGGLWVQPRLAKTTLIGSEAIKAALATGIAVLTWVALWTPLSGFVLEWVPFSRTRRAYQAMLKMELTVLPEPPGSGCSERAGRDPAGD